jgi:putative proteasome-type protease
MTYCVGVLLDAGMVFASDSRTNAGVDHVSSFRKMTVYDRPGDRVIVILSSGNLSVTQNAINLLESNAKRGDGSPNVWNAHSLFEIATLLGDCLRDVKRRDAAYLTQNNIDANANFILGGQVKYGKPIIDRVVKRSTSVIDATKCVLISFDSTMRSNVSVGLPIDLVTYAKDSLRIQMQRRITETDPYFTMIHHQWGEGLRRVFAQLPDPYWEDAAG